MIPKFIEWLKLKEMGTAAPGIVGRNVPDNLQGSPMGAQANGKPYKLKSVGDVEMKKSKK